MIIISRYLFKQIFLSTIALSFILLAIFWLVQSLRFIDYLMNKGLSLGVFLQLSIFLLPSFASKILPIAFFIAAILVFSKLYTDRELVVIRTSGLSNWRILLPVMYVATVFLAIIYFINIYLQPIATQKFSNMKSEISNNLTGKWIQPGIFNNFNNITFYTKDKTYYGHMKGILVYDNSNDNSPITITADSGRIIESPIGLNLILFNGSHQSFDYKSGKTNMVEFEEYNLHIANMKASIRHKKPNELSMAELFSPGKFSNNRQKLIRVERHERLLLPLSIYPLALMIGVSFLVGEYQRKQKQRKILTAISFMVFLQILTMTLLNLADKYEYAIEVSYYLYLFIFTGLTFTLFFKKQN